MAKFLPVLIYLVVYVSFLGASLINWKAESTPSKNVLFGVTLHDSALNSPEIGSAQERFRRLCIKWWLISTLLFLPSVLLPFLLPGQFMISFVYLMIWVFTAGLFSMNRPYLLIRHQLQKLKTEKGWFYGVVRETTVDTQAARLKDRRVPPAWLFLPAALLPAALMVVRLMQQSTAMILLPVVCIAMKGLFYLCYRYSKNLKSRVWSENSRINVAVNCERQRVWSQFFIISAYFDTAFSMILWELTASRQSSPYFVMIAILADTLAELALVFYSFQAVRKSQNFLTQMDQQPLVTDDDEYWKDSWVAGEVYCNPNDQSVMVEKRIGTGMTPNVATKKGWLFYYGIFGSAAALVTVLCVLFLLLGSSTTTLQIDEKNHIVSVHAFLYGTQFSDNSIESVSLVNTIPAASRTNGADDGTYALGHFSVDGYGSCLLYVYENKPPYVLIRLQDRAIFYNEKTRALTLETYKRLVQAKEGNQ